MRTNYFVFVITALIFAAACGGGGDLSPGAGDDFGTGTGTLQVTGIAAAVPNFPNAANSTDFTTVFEVRIQKASVPIVSATVSITSAAGTVPLTFDTRSGGTWIGLQNGYYQVYQLDVVSGTDTVQSVRVDGPDQHTFTAPIAGATVNATMPLLVTWKRSDTADRAQFRSKELNSTDVADTGSFTVPVGGLKSKPDQAESETLRLERSSQITPVGATAGSTWIVSVSNAIDVAVAATGI